MKITDVQAIILRQPTMDVSKADGSQDALLIRIETDEGITGVGFDPGVSFGTAVGATLTFCVASFVGFESAALYGQTESGTEEATEESTSEKSASEPTSNGTTGTRRRSSTLKKHSAAPVTPTPAPQGPPAPAPEGTESSTTPPTTHGPRSG